MADALFFLHRLAFARGSDALDFVRALRESSEAPSRSEALPGGPVLVYGARIVTPDMPAELYVSVGALTLAYALGMDAIGRRFSAPEPKGALPADLALLFVSSTPSDRSLSTP